MNEILKKLVEIHGATGSENKVREIISAELHPYVDEIRVDRFGNLVARKGSAHNSLKLLLTAHMDEPALAVDHVTGDGLIEFEKIGAIDDRVLLSQWVDIETAGGQVLGIIGARQPDLDKDREKAVPYAKLFVDIGATNKDEVERAGVSVGDPIVFHREVAELANGKLVVGKALDNRVGCTVLIETMKRLAKEKLSFSVYAAATVQEEIGGRGAQIVASVIDPMVAIAIDTATATYPLEEARVKSGQGPVVNFVAKSLMTGMWLVSPQKLRNLFVDVAKGEGIPFQPFIELKGATDANYMSLRERGIPSIAVLVPIKYAHSSSEYVLMDDLEKTVALLVAVVKNMTPNLFDK